MSNDYKSSNIEYIATDGMMYNEATLKRYTIPYEDHGIFRNDNTYAVTFNHDYNRPIYYYFKLKPVRLPPTNEHKTKLTTEPPAFMTDGLRYIHSSRVKPPPLLPPYLGRAEDHGLLQGRALEFNKGNVIYGPKHKVVVENNVY